MTLNKDTKVADVVAEYPWFRKEASRINERFAMLNTPIAKFMLASATIGDMSTRSGMSVEDIISGIEKLVAERE